MKYLWVNIKGFGFCFHTNAYAHAYYKYVYVYVYTMDADTGLYHAARNTLTWLDPGLVAAEVRLTLTTRAYLLHSRR